MLRLMLGMRWMLLGMLLLRVLRGMLGMLLGMLLLLLRVLLRGLLVILHRRLRLMRGLKTNAKQPTLRGRSVENELSNL